MKSEPLRIPPGPLQKYDNSCDLLTWLVDRFEEFGDIYSASIYGVDVYVVNAAQYIEHVLLKNWENYPKGRAIKRIGLLLGNGLMTSKGSQWSGQRRMIQPAFAPARLEALTGVVTRANAALLQQWIHAAHAKSSINVTRDVSRLVLEILLMSIFGDDYSEAAVFNVIAEAGSRDLAFAIQFKSLGQVVVQIVQRRQRENRVSNDILGAMMQARDRDTGEAMPVEQLMQEVMTLIVAGHETTASTLNWTWYLLSQHPLAEAKLSEELDRMFKEEVPRFDELSKFRYARWVIEEALRLYPPGWLMTRRALHDDRLGDYFVPAGTEVYIAPFTIQRHPQLWDLPEAFEPERFEPKQHNGRAASAMMPFSIGPRNCIGEHFARMEMQIHLMMIGRQLRLHHAGSEPPGLRAGVNLLSANDIFMTPEIKLP